MQEERVTKYQSIKIQGSAYEGGRQLGKLVKQACNLVGYEMVVKPGSDRMEILIPVK